MKRLVHLIQVELRVTSWCYFARCEDAQQRKTQLSSSYAKFRALGIYKGQLEFARMIML